ncbi:cytochrome c biogenesis protein CcdC [Paenibacillus sp. SYP-B3998]|uniref:Cytochrome c biogenesis protein CcdC n=1 Tax=Paenibacillus sp. SYP-B3998 TaxID=2678564 RepID=A0A6G3ZTC9_9BACL|nr:cytochrome c biogenesis protein CcdC [Paenibacillus sp. SYP-B3998]NEW05375.1 cytochrome c biogenesis protein CcdC [Paenibacillus sp. SYP-B3998]
MSFTFTSHLHAVSLIGSLGAALVVMFARLRAASKPVNAAKIIMPPIGMTTGFLMFVVPMMRIPLLWGIAAFLTGAILFAYPLIRTSKFYVLNGFVYMKRSKAFLAILLILLIIRLSLHEYVEAIISIYQTGAIFFILAYGMLLPWRIAMYMQYRNLRIKNEQ